MGRLIPLSRVRYHRRSRLFDSRDSPEGVHGQLRQSRKASELKSGDRARVEIEGKTYALFNVREVLQHRQHLRPPRGPLGEGFLDGTV